jgi:hypothetical protein
MNPSYLNQRPGLITAIAIMTLTSGIVNIIWTAVGFAHFLGVICAPITILPAILGICEIIYAAKLLGAPNQRLQPSQPIAAFEIACLLFGNFFSMVVGILTLVFYNDLTVKDYFARLNGTLTPAPVITHPAPASPPDPGPAPVMEELPQPEETPAPPKRIRKLAGK